MIYKSFEIKNINFDKFKIFLFYGKNDVQKEEAVNYLKNNNEFFSYEQNEVIEKKESFFNEIYTKSLFGEKKIIIIKRVTDKILNIIEEIEIKKIEDTKIVLIADILEKKSRLRLKFEKEKYLVCAPFYPDTRETLLRLASSFFKANKISISHSTINTIIDKTNEDRSALINEIEKIKLYTINDKKIDDKNILKLVNLNENHGISELIDNCLLKNKTKTIKILNDNNFNNDDCILVTRIFLNKSKKIHELSKKYENNNDINLTISSARPPIFWKDKENIKQQVLNWTTKGLKELLFDISEIELLIKKNINNSVNILTNFIIEKSSTEN